jgi:hypothetical protein
MAMVFDTKQALNKLEQLLIHSIMHISNNLSFGQRMSPV